MKHLKKFNENMYDDHMRQEQENDPNWGKPKDGKGNEPLNSTQNALLKDFYKIIDEYSESLSDEEILMIISRLSDEYYENM